MRDVKDKYTPLVCTEGGVSLRCAAGRLRAENAYMPNTTRDSIRRSANCTPVGRDTKGRLSRTARSQPIGRAWVTVTH